MSNIKKVTIQLENKQIIILGLGREGLSTYKFIRKLLPYKKLVLVDEKDRALLSSEWHQILEQDSSVKFQQNFNHLDIYSVVLFKTPGIPPQNKLVLKAQQMKFEISSNLNLFFQLVEGIDKEKLTTVGVTGTKGKSTTTAITNHTLSSCGIHSFIAGNIGIPLLDIWDQLNKTLETNLTGKPVIVVAELSSHQLNDATDSPDIAVILDISPEHLDYYKNFEEYIQAKSQISKFQTQDDLVIFNPDYKLPTKIANIGKAKQITFTKKQNIIDNWLSYNNEKIVDIDTLPLVGEHTIMNALPGIIIARELGCEAHDISSALLTFKSLPHRLELVADKNGVKYFNDSLSTTPESTIAALQSFKHQPIILIAGGYDRNLNYSKLAEVIVNHDVKHLILLPDTGKRIIEETQKHMANNEVELKHTTVSSMKEAVSVAKKHAQENDIVLLSPASASFNMFKDYKERGDLFRKFSNL